MHCGPKSAKSYAVNDTMMKRHSIFAHWRIYSFFLEPTDPLDLKSKTDGPFNCIRHGCFMCVNVTFRPRTSKIQSSCSSTTTTTPNVQGRQANGLKATTDHRRCGQAAASDVQVFVLHGNIYPQKAVPTGYLPAGPPLRSKFIIKCFVNVIASSSVRKI